MTYTSPIILGQIYQDPLKLDSFVFFFPPERSFICTLRAKGLIHRMSLEGSRYSHIPLPEEEAYPGISNAN